MKNRSRTLTFAAVAVPVALLLVAAGFLFFGSGLRRRETTLPTAELLNSKVRSLLSLPAVEHEYREIIYFDSERSFLFIPTSSKQLLFSVNIRVQAGVDLMKGFELIPSETERGKITVRLPGAEILLVDADEESISQYFVRERGDRIRLLEFGDEIRKLKDRVRADAERRGILAQADGTVRKLIGNFLKLQGFTAVAFEQPAAGGAE